MLTWVWVGMIFVAAVYGAGHGTAAAVGAAAAEGTAAALRLGAGMLGGVMFWSGLMEVMDQAGLTALLARCLSPLLYLLYPSCREDEALRGDLCCNFSANLLGLGNAATPAGIRAAAGLRKYCRGELISRELCTLVVMNTASVQLLPATVAAVRAALGAAAPYDILPSVWITSLLSVSAGLGTAALLFGKQ